MKVTDTQFVEASRQEIVVGLQAVFQQCVETSTPRWVSLEGPSGCGKSRVVREFYRLLAQAQQAPAYWPESLVPLDDSLVGEVNERRKRTTPHWQGSPGAVPDYMWWGIDCGRLNGCPSERLAVALHQFEDHAEPLDKAYAESAKNPLKLKNLLSNSIAALRAEGFTEASTEFLGKGLEALSRGDIDELPGSGMVVRTGLWAWNKHQEKKTRERVVQAGKAIDRNANMEPIDEAFETLRRLSYKSILPTIIFVEDLHDADEALLSLLEKILRSSGNAVMVITTTWSNELSHRPELESIHGLLEDECTLGDRFHRLTENGADAIDSPVQGSFAPIGLESKVSIIRDYAPDVSDGTAQALAQRYGQPLLLELVLNEPSLWEEFGDALELLDAEDIKGLPATHDQYYQQTWDRLPQSGRDSLLYSAIGVPHKINNSEQHGLESSLQLLVDAIDSAGISHQCVAAFEDEPRLLGWGEPVDVRLSRFREWQHLEYVSSNYKLVDVRRIRVLTALGELASNALLNETKGFGEDGYLERLVLALAAVEKIGNKKLRERLISDKAVVEKAAFRRLKALSEFPSEIQQCIELAELALESTSDVSSLDAFYYRDLIAGWTSELGHTTNSLGLYRELLADQEAALGQEHLYNLGVRSMIAGLIKEQNPIKGRVLFEQLLPDIIAEYGESHSITLDTRLNILNAPNDDGSDSGRIDKMKELLAEMMLSLGVDHQVTLFTRGLVAEWVAQEDDAAAAISLFEDLLQDQLRVFGPDDPDVLDTRCSIAAWVGIDGDPEAALGLYRTLLIDSERVLGIDHPDCYRIRSEIAGCTLACGDMKTAIALYEKLLEDQEQTLGHNPSTFNTRDGIADWVFDHEGADRALQFYGELLQDQEETLGVDHVDNFHTRSCIAGITLQDIDVAQATKLYRSLLQDQERVCGPLSNHAFETRECLARCAYVDSGAESSLEIYKELLRDQKRVFKADNEYTFTTRSGIAECVIECEGEASALPLLKELLADQIRLLGSGDASVVKTRGLIADCVVEIEGPASALPLYEKFLEGQVRIFGSDDEDVLNTRRTIAEFTAEIGDIGEVHQLYEALFEDQERVLGAQDERTLSTRGSIAECVKERSGAAKALPLYEALLDDQVCALGTDNEGVFHTRYGIAECKSSCGDDDTAFVLFKALLKDVERVLGPEAELTQEIKETLGEFE